jgi:diketogulonate reductase-like aldo/keto reductase
MAASIKSLKLSSGQAIPVLGMGTWQMGENDRDRPSEVAALRHGLELGLSLIDTAEMYGEGGAELVIAEAIAGRRADVFLTSKVYPHNASMKGAIEACEQSLKRLNTDYLDLYLLHWRSSVPLEETLGAFQKLHQSGKIRSYGVSNFDTKDMKKTVSIPGGREIVTNQVLYNLMRRGIEWDLLPWCRQQNIPIMAYSPIEQGRLLQNQTLQTIATDRQVSTAEVAIAWLLHQEQVIVIPKSSNIAHVEKNRAALDLKLTIEELQILDAAFPAPRRSVPLEII